MRRARHPCRVQFATREGKGPNAGNGGNKKCRLATRVQPVGSAPTSSSCDVGTGSRASSSASASYASRSCSSSERMARCCKSIFTTAFLPRFRKCHRRLPGTGFVPAAAAVAGDCCSRGPLGASEPTLARTYARSSSKASLEVRLSRVSGCGTWRSPLMPSMPSPGPLSPPHAITGGGRADEVSPMPPGASAKCEGGATTRLSVKYPESPVGTASMSVSKAVPGQLLRPSAPSATGFWSAKAPGGGASATSTEHGVGDVRTTVASARFGPRCSELPARPTLGFRSLTPRSLITAARPVTVTMSAHLPGAGVSCAASAQPAPTDAASGPSKSNRRKTPVPESNSSTLERRRPAGSAAAVVVAALVGIGTSSGGIHGGNGGDCEAPLRSEAWRTGGTGGCLRESCEDTHAKSRTDVERG